MKADLAFAIGTVFTYGSDLREYVGNFFTGPFLWLLSRAGVDMCSGSEPNAKYQCGP